MLKYVGVLFLAHICIIRQPNLLYQTKFSIICSNSYGTNLNWIGSESNSINK